MARFVALVIVALLAAAAPLCAQRVVAVSTADELQALLARPLDSVEIRLTPGSYHLVPTSRIDQTCGNCPDSSTRVPYTLGIRVSGRSVRIVGPANRSAEIITHAGYGVLVEDCDDCALESLTITGGERDTSGAATDAAIVVRRSRVAITGNRIAGNLGDSTVVGRVTVGISGICGREGADMLVERNDIMRNSWDGIALYRGARATIRGNIIDGVDAATGARIAGGRGVGIGVTWNAMATIEENLVRRYWKGIGVFVDARAYVRRNIVEEILTWGVSVWDAGTGRPHAEFIENVIYATGACGAAINRTAPGIEPGAFERNVVVATAQNPKYDAGDYYCRQCALAIHAMPVGFRINDNLFYANRRGDSTLPRLDVSDEEFLRAVRPHCDELARIPSLVRSDFLRRHCADSDLESERN